MNDSTLERSNRSEQQEVSSFKFQFFRGAVRLAQAFVFSSALGVFGAAAEPLRVATFDVDATPPVGYMMAYDPVLRLDAMTLRCRGIVLLGQAAPIVLCAVDWIGIANEAHDAFREQLAKAAGTTPDRVAVHTLHQHDAPLCDFLAERLLKEAKAKYLGELNGDFCRQTLAKVSVAVKASLAFAKPVTHCGWGEAEVPQLKEVLPRFTRLKALDLSRNALGAAAASAIASLLKTTQISSLKCAAQPRTLPQWLPVLSAPIATHSFSFSWQLGRQPALRRRALWRRHLHH